jgi:hypothetical protein
MTMISVLVPYAALWLAISVLLPHGSAPWYRLIPGAVFLGIGTQLLHLVTVYYLAHKIESASELYGGLGVAATLLLGLYLVSRLIVGAAVLNATLWDRSRLRNEVRRSEAASDADGVDGQSDGVATSADTDGSAIHTDVARHPEVAGTGTGSLTVERADEAAVDHGPS